MFDLRLGASLHTICDSVTTDVLAAVCESAIATLEFAPKLLDSDHPEETISLVRSASAGGQVRIATIHAPFGGRYDLSSLDDAVQSEGLNELWRSLDLAGALNAPMIVVHASAEPIDAAARGRRLAQARKALAKMAERCEESGVRIAVELLPRTCLGNTVEELVELLRGLDPERFGVCLDTNHLMDGYAQLPEHVLRLGERLFTLHVSDYDGVDEKHELPGKGVVDWEAFLKALKQTGYAGPFNYECKPDGVTYVEKIRLLEENFAWMCGLLGA